MSFEQLNLIEPLLKSLQDEGYTVPTPIQQKSIPIILQGRDLLGCAQTGTGKTAAFALPMLQLMQNNAVKETKKSIKALIVTPTRELAIQIDESFEAYGKYTNITHTVIFGGVSYRPQRNILVKGVDVLIATPGRLIDLINQEYIDLSTLSLFVLDEADRMLDMGFVHDIKKILKYLPKKRQSLFFSATMPAEIVKLAEKILDNPAKVEVTPVSSTAETIQQAVYFVDKGYKKDLLNHLLKDVAIESALVFTRTKHGADKVARTLRESGIEAQAIHGNKSQNNRQLALSRFKNKEIRVLVATDIAARGIDIDSLSHVINYEIPNIPETYVHRIGRTGRAGAEGISLSFCDQEEKAFLRDIHKLINKNIPVIEDHPYPLTNQKMPEQKEPSRNSNQDNAERRIGNYSPARKPQEARQSQSPNSNQDRSRSSFGQDSSRRQGTSERRDVRDNNSSNNNSNQDRNRSSFGQDSSRRQGTSEGRDVRDNNSSN
ncbi:MAG: DEAD/DEAH box helicase, partial [Candidatus Sericytochromatia bacterium]|nr:DEAD/DEAH box helicase [Candidatus Sericytochromatia bacterium]